MLTILLLLGGVAAFLLGGMLGKLIVLTVRGLRKPTNDDWLF